MMINEVSQEEPIDMGDIELENKSSKSRSRVENASILTINQDSHGQKTQGTDEALERKGTETDTLKQNSSH
jgi:hypothetical protein